MAPLPAELKEHFCRDGFLLVPDLVDGALLDRVVPEIDAACGPDISEPRHPWRDRKV